MRQHILSLNPLVLLAFGLFSLLGSVWVRDVPTGLIALSAYAVAGLLFLPGWRYALGCLGLGLIAALTVVYSTWRGGGHHEWVSLTAGLRTIVLAVPGSIAAGYIDPARLGDYLAQSLRLPGRPVAAFTAAIQRFADFLHVWQELESARRVRGLGPDRNPVRIVAHMASMAFGLLVEAMRGASQTAIAMDARGFASAHHRTWAEPASWSRVDRIALALAILLGLVPAVTHVLG